jgi:hypothetical protein
MKGASIKTMIHAFFAQDRYQIALKNKRIRTIGAGKWSKRLKTCEGEINQKTNWIILIISLKNYRKKIQEKKRTSVCFRNQQALWRWRAIPISAPQTKERAGPVSLCTETPALVFAQHSKQRTPNESSREHGDDGRTDGRKKFIRQNTIIFQTDAYKENDPSWFRMIIIYFTPSFLLVTTASTAANEIYVRHPSVVARGRKVCPGLTERAGTAGWVFSIASMKADESGWLAKGGHNFLSIFWHDRTRLSRAFFYGQRIY